MEDIQVAIKNYQIIGDARLTFEEGLTLIVGSSNNGKSAIIRAIEAAIYNKLGNSFIKSGTDSAIVGLSMNGHRVIWRKSASEGIYKVDGQTYNKIGRGQLAEVGDALGITELDVNGEKVRINFLKQMEYPFLLDKNPTQLFEFLSMSNDIEKLSSILKTMRQDLRSTETNISVEIGKIDTFNQIISRNEKFLEQYKDIDSVVDKVLDLDSKVEQYKELGDRVAVLEDSYSSLLDRKPQLLALREHVKKVDESMQGVEERVASYKDLSDMVSHLDTISMSLSEKETKVKALKDSISKYSVLDNIDIDSIKQHGSALDEMKLIVSKLSSTFDKLSSMRTDILSLRSSVADTEKELSSFSVCPLCGSLLPHGH